MATRLPPEHRVIGRRVYAARKRRGLSQPELSIALGLAPSAIGSIERGKTAASAVLLQRIAAALNVSAALLLGETTDPRPTTRAERRLLRRYRDLPRDRRAALARIVATPSHPEPASC